MNYPDTEQGWIDLAEEIARDARDAARAADKKAMQKSVDACADFVSNRTSDCPKEVVEAVAGVQVELSQLTVADDVAAIAGRTKQFDAYLQDIDRLSDRAGKSADLISFKSARDVVDGVTDVVNDVKALRKSVKSGDTDAVTQGLDDIVSKLQQIQDDFDKLSG